MSSGEPAPAVPTLTDLVLPAGSPHTAPRAAQGGECEFSDFYDLWDGSACNGSANPGSGVEELSSTVLRR
jgi:hypothetical protein